MFHLICEIAKEKIGVRIVISHYIDTQTKDREKSTYPDTHVTYLGFIYTNKSNNICIFPMVLRVITVDAAILYVH